MTVVDLHEYDVTKKWVIITKISKQVENNNIGKNKNGVETVALRHAGKHQDKVGAAIPTSLRYSLEIS